MTQVAVIHTAFEDSPRTVAFVDVPELSSVNEMFDEMHIGGQTMLWVLGVSKKNTLRTFKEW